MRESFNPLKHIGTCEHCGHFLEAGGNPNHDERGRFSSGGGTGDATGQSSGGLSTEELRRAVSNIGLRRGGPPGVWIEQATHAELAAVLDAHNQSRGAAYSHVADALDAHGHSDAANLVRTLK